MRIVSKTGLRPTSAPRRFFLFSLLTAVACLASAIESRAQSLPKGKRLVWYDEEGVSIDYTTGDGAQTMSSLTHVGLLTDLAVDQAGGKILEPGQCGCDLTDSDRELDGSADCLDLCPADSAKTAPGICGCGTADKDSNLNGTADCKEKKKKKQKRT